MQRVLEHPSALDRDGSCRTNLGATRTRGLAADSPGLLTVQLQNLGQCCSVWLLHFMAGLPSAGRRVIHPGTARSSLSLGLSQL